MIYSHRVRACTVLLDVCIEPFSLSMIEGETEVNIYMSNTNLEIRIGYVGVKM